jgi:uracil-DNA glycosylase
VNILDRVIRIIDMAHAGPASRLGPVFNPWADHDPLDAHDEGPDERRMRLLFHFTGIMPPKLLLIGEAPGYQGCHFSGVPFTNEALICEGVIPRMPIGRLTTREKPWSEPSATIVWKALHELKVSERTVMWNAYPWHPHKEGDPMSNRTPKYAELKEGLHVLQTVIQAFPDATVVAVGRAAEKSLALLGRNMDVAVRHPSMGGAKDFRDGLAAIVNGLGR